MPCRVEVGLKPGLFDARGERTKKQILHAFPSLCEQPSILCFDVYNIDRDNLDHKVLSEAFCDPVIQEFAVNEPLSTDFDWYIEIGFRPGVTDNVGHSAKYTLKLITGEEIPVYSARAYLIKGAIERELATKIARECLSNSLIQNFRVLDPIEISSIEPYIPVVDIDHEPRVEHISLEMVDDDLLRLSQERTLALSVEELKTISSYLKNPQVLEKRSNMGLDSKITDVELECLAQTWSEHCKHKIFNADILYEEDGSVEKISSLFKTYIQKSTTDIRQRSGKDDICVSVFTDNAGVIRFNDDYNLVYKVETHNSPSALDPYGGALTGIVGVNRDPFGTGMGSKLIFNTDVFCFADPFFAENLPPKILHPIRIFEGVREGVEHGGNKSGIPTVNGCIVFDNRYLGKPLVYCGTAGIMPATINGKASHEKHICSGDLIIMSGGRIGKDGIHGATFSSEELHEASPTSAVQIGDPITQKKLTDFLLRARDKDLYRAITDNGAGGLSSSVGEMAQLCGGCRIKLDKPLLKYQGLSPWEILLSEAQERMTLAVPVENIDEFMELSSQMDVESTVIGEFNNSGYFHCTFGDDTVAYIELDFLHNGLPKMNLSAIWEETFTSDPVTPVPDDHNKMLEKMLSRLNICSKEYVIRQYDHEVQGGSVIKPLVGKFYDGPSDAAVIRPILESNEGVVVSNGIIPRYSDIDTYHMTACALDEALRNYICVGGDPHHWACLDNFCWCDPITSEKNPDGAYKLAQLVRSNKALFAYTKAFNCPLISGKDSMKNDYIGPGIKISIPPTILISVIGKIKDASKAVSMDIKKPGHHIFVLGHTKKELGGSEYFASFDIVGSSVPKVDAPRAMERYEKIHAAITDGLIASAHDISDGGLAVSLAEMAFSGEYGMHVNLGAIKTQGDLNDTEILYSETASRIIIGVIPENAPEIENIFGEDAQFIGTSVEEKRLRVIGQDQKSTIIEQDIQTLKRAWKEPLDL